MEQALASSFQYLFFLLQRADGPVTVFHEALRARALETAVRMAPFGPVNMKVDLHNINAIFFRDIIPLSCLRQNLGLHL